MILSVCSENGKYDVTVERGGIFRAGEFFPLERKVLVLTDDGVPAEYAEAVAKQCGKPFILTLEAGEKAKSIEGFSKVVSYMLQNGFDRHDCVVSVGGGVVGDLAGFVASSYMRGVDFYNIPTTVLSQVDSSIGGKTAINFEGIKNIVGAFYPPKGVIVDPDLLSTLPDTQISNGLAESVKMALTFDRLLFELIENGDFKENLQDIIERSLLIKKNVVEADEKESGLRKVLNFGHTVGHGIESLGEGLYHGECVALGMIPMCSESVRKRLVPVLEKLNLPTSCPFDPEKIMNAVLHDKKSNGETITTVTVCEIGSYEMRNETPSDLMKRIETLTKGMTV